MSIVSLQKLASPPTMRDVLPVLSSLRPALRNFSSAQSTKRFLNSSTSTAIARRSLDRNGATITPWISRQKHLTHPALSQVPGFVVRRFSSVPNDSNGTDSSETSDTQTLATDPTRSVAATNFPGTKQTEAYLLQYTCKVCNHTEAKKISKQSYHKGVVIIQCSNCKKRHLIADNLGWFFDDSKNVEDFMLEQGQKVVKTFRDASGDWKMKIVQGEKGVKGQASGAASGGEGDVSSSEGGSTDGESGVEIPLSDKDALELTSGNFLEFLKRNDMIHVEGAPEDASSETETAPKEEIVDRATEVVDSGKKE